MDEKHPKRRKDKYNIYRISQKDERCFLSFADGENVVHNIEIDQSLYNLFNEFELDDLVYPRDKILPPVFCFTDDKQVLQLENCILIHQTHSYCYCNKQQATLAAAP